MKQARDYRKYNVRLTSADWQRGSCRVITGAISVKWKGIFYVMLTGNESHAPGVVREGWEIAYALMGVHN